MIFDWNRKCNKSRKKDEKISQMTKLLTKRYFGYLIYSEIFKIQVLIKTFRQMEFNLTSFKRKFCRANPVRKIRN